MNRDERQALINEFIEYLNEKELKEKKPIVIRRTSEIYLKNINCFQVGDIIDFTLSTGEAVSAIATKRQKGGMLFVFVDLLKDKYPMNNTNTNEGGYKHCELRKTLHKVIYPTFPKEIKSRIGTFYDGDYLRLLSEREVFGENKYGKKDDCEQLELMKNIKNRIAFLGKDTGEGESYWLQNGIKDGDCEFTIAYSNGTVTFGNASLSLGVRPAFILY